MPLPLPTPMALPLDIYQWIINTSAYLQEDIQALKVNQSAAQRMSV